MNASANQKEIPSTFYDLEYCLAQEYRYLSGAFNSKVNNLMSAIGNISGKKILDVGCGAGFLTNELHKRGADIVGIDYSEAQIPFAKERFPYIDFRVASVYELSESEFDIITLFDVIEHLGDFKKALVEIKKVLKPNGLLTISTDLHRSSWFYKFNRFSKDGRAHRLIKKVESYRKRFKNYHNSHINEQSYDSLEKILISSNFEILKHSVFPLVGVSIRDFFLRFLSKKFRGDSQCVVAINK